MKTFTQAVEDFLEAADWLTDVDQPAVVSLQQAAAELDSAGVQAALLNTYGITYRQLLKRAGRTDAVDEAEDFLNSL